jgi:hypothetical protein
MGRRTYRRRVVRRNIVFGVVTLVVIVVVLGAIGRPAGPSSPPQTQPQTQSDATVQADMMSAINDDMGGAQSGVRFNAPGQPDISYKDGVLFVASLLDPNDTSAVHVLCTTIKAFAHDPNTGADLGVHSVVVIEGTTKLTSC